MTSPIFDVLIVGAGLSGIGAAYFLQRDCPQKSYLILEGRERIGGTWDLFRYPGIRSDSDMHTFGYSFRPWSEARAIVDGPAILQYLEETARNYRVDRRIRFGQTVHEAHWASDEQLWRLTVEDRSSGQTVDYRCRFLLMCSGYYSYEAGYTPDFAGRDRFAGPIVHPQQWPDDLDYAGKRIAIIGSGATAVTLAPALAETAAHVTLVQRSPSYIAPLPAVDPVARLLNRWLPAKLAYRLIRWKNITYQQFVYRRSRKSPEKVKQRLLQMVRAELGPDYDVDQHFTPSYDPWDQRLCVAPDGDLFAAIRAGKITMVTDTIERFTESGIRLQSGDLLPADVIVTATGLDLLLLGGVRFWLDDRPIDFAQHVVYKGLMYSDVPNLASIFGYVNASWTLRSDLFAQYVCRLLNTMDEVGATTATPRLPPPGRMRLRPLFDAFSPNYIRRKIAELPKQGDRPPWSNVQGYSYEKRLLQRPVDDGVLQFERQTTTAPLPQ